MFDELITASPSVGSWRHDPMTTSEIDAHPDADRIWATIKVMQDEIDDARQQGFEEGSGEVDEAVKEEQTRCVEMLDDWCETLLDRPDLITADDIRDHLIATNFTEVTT